MGRCDKWTILRIIEVLLVLGCLVCKRVTDDEARSLFLYLQKLSREWSLLTNVTWDRVGSSVADAAFGGYLIITFALLVGKIYGELPTERRIMEWVLLGVGAVLFIVIGSLAFASIDSIPHDLVDNAAVLGTLSVVTGLLFLLDMGAPKAKKQMPPAQIKEVRKKETSNLHEIESTRHWTRNGTDEPTRGTGSEQVFDIVQDTEVPRRSTHSAILEEQDKRKSKKESKNNGIKNGYHNNGNSRKLDMILKEPSRSYIHLDPTSNGYKQMRNDDFDIPRRFGIYGKDVVDATDTDETASLPPQIELHTPVWGNIRKETAKVYHIPPVVPPPSQRLRRDDLPPPPRPPSGPLDPGFVQYTAEHWGEPKKNGTKTPRHSPTTDV